MTERTAEQFVAANNDSLVVSGAVLDMTKGGGRYRLENGRSFALSVDECRRLPTGYPKWKLP